MKTRHEPADHHDAVALAWAPGDVLGLHAQTIPSRKVRVLSVQVLRGVEHEWRSGV